MCALRTCQKGRSDSHGCFRSRGHLGSDSDEVVEEQETGVRSQESGVGSDVVPKIAFLFPGQGSQYPGMGRELAESYPAARGVFDTADAALRFPLSRICFE